MIDAAKILERAGSTLRNPARVALAGFEAALRQAIVGAPADDPGLPACREAIEHLSRSLASPAAPVGPVEAPRDPPPEPVAWQEPPPADVVPSSPAAALAPAAGADGDIVPTFLADPAVRKDLGAAEPSPTTGDLAPFWPRSLLLRASESVFAAWAGPLGRSAGGGGADVVLPSSRDEKVLPGTPGVRLAASAPLDPRVGDRPGGSTLCTLRQIISVILWYMDVDHDLHHALRSVYQFGVVPLRKGTHRVQFERELLKRLDRLAEAEESGGPVEFALAWASLDEAIHSLVHRPLAPEDSWWRRLQKEARDTLSDVRDRVIRSERTFHLVIPSGRYSEAKQYTDPPNDKSGEGPVSPGDVVQALRVYLKIEGAEYPGRVLYYPR